MKAASSLAACGIQYQTAGVSSIAFRLPTATDEVVRSRRHRDEDEEHLAGDATSPGQRAHGTEGELSTEDYLCEIHESWLSCWLDADVDGAMSHLERASETLQGLSPNELFYNSICDMAINPDGESTTTATAATAATATATATATITATSTHATAAAAAATAPLPPPPLALPLPLLLPSPPVVPRQPPPVALSMLHRPLLLAQQPSPLQPLPMQPLAGLQRPSPKSHPP